MAEYLQQILAPIANRVKPIFVTMPPIHDIDQISLFTCHTIIKKLSYKIYFQCFYLLSLDKI